MTDDVRDAPAVAAESDSQASEAETEHNEPATAETPSDEAEADSPAPVRRLLRGLPRRVRKIAPVALVLLLLISGGVATWLYFKQYRPDQQTNAGTAQAVVRAASDGTVAVLSYSFDSLDKDFANARSHLTGDFLTYYDQFTSQSVAPVAQQRAMKTTAKVTEAAVSELHPDSAVVLLFVDQVSTTKDSAQPSVTLTNALVHLTRINGSWLINQFTPV